LVLPELVLPELVLPELVLLCAATSAAHHGRKTNVEITAAGNHLLAILVPP
jgi:hypothetical protein